MHAAGTSVNKALPNAQEKSSPFNQELDMPAAAVAQCP